MLDDEAAPAKLVARLGEEEAETELRAAAPAGAGIVIRLEGVDHGALRYRWNKHVLEVGARHPSLKRYLGPKAESYPGQNAMHFRVLLTEVIAEALCARRLEGNIEANPNRLRGDELGRLLPALRPADVTVPPEGTRSDGSGGLRAAAAPECVPPTVVTPSDPRSPPASGLPARSPN